jgi:alpha-L-rhamnosidase
MNSPTRFRFQPLASATGLAWLLLLSAFTVFGRSSNLHVTDLRCEYLKNPLGIDAPLPRLSWQLEAAKSSQRNQRQTACRILVATRAALLKPDHADLWDSGVLTTDQSAHLVYQGTPLRSGQQCLWKVQVRDQDGLWTAWSPDARWTMGPLQASDWSAQWIGIATNFVKGKGWPPPDNTIPDPWLRKTFNLDAKPRRAFIHVASVGYHELYVNGQKADDTVLAPCVSDHSKRARYVTYDIGPFLRPGKNVLGLWLGFSWSIFPHYQTTDKPRSPIVIAQAEIELADGQITRLVTDATWKTHPSPNTLLGVWDFMHYGGEQYDARQELPDWCQPSGDDSGWTPVTVYHPNLILSAHTVEPNRRVTGIRPLSVQTLSNGVYRVDMGVNYSGWLEMDLKGEPGDAIEFQFSEDPKLAMTHRLHSRYILGSSGKGTFRNRFNYNCGRWIQIHGLRQKPALGQIRGWLVRTDYQRATQFECSVPLINRICEATLWTFENLSLGGYVVDCPQRERMGYGGDAHATTETGLNHYQLGAFYTKWAEDWRDVQKPDGNLPYTAPTYWGGGGPAWSGYCITLPWEIYQRYGDRRILELSFPTLERWLAFLETKSAHNRLERWGGEWDFLGDWLWPGAKGVNGDTRETLFFNNCYWIYNLQTAARIARVLGKTDDAARYESRAQEVRAAVHREFFLPDTHSYVNGFQSYLATALLVGLPPADLQPAVWRRLEQEILGERKGHIHAGITGGAFLFKTLMTHDRQDLLYTMVRQEDYPSWGDMLKRGATTLWESWEGGDLSLLHSSYLYVGAWFIQGLAGIKPDPQHPGFQRFIIKPGIVNSSELRWVKASHESIYGKILAHWSIDNAQFRLRIAVPPNTTATVYLPTDQLESAKESGRSLSAAKGVRLLAPTQDCAAVEVGSGNYSFETHWPGMRTRTTE